MTLAQDPHLATAMSHAPDSAMPLALEIAHLSHTYPAIKKRRSVRGKKSTHSTTSAGSTNSQTPNRPALSDVSLSLAQGQSLALLGPNGSGKSTLLRVCATLLTPSDPASSIQIAGYDVKTQASQVRHAIGVVFQSPSIDEQLTCRENLLCHGQVFGLPSAMLKQRIPDLLEKLQLADRSNAPAHTLSGGMQRRLEIAKALLPDPNILLMDEPDTGLDPHARETLWSLLSDLQTQGRSIVVTTHLIDAADMCDRIALLDEGQLLAFDTPEALKADLAEHVVSLTPDSQDADLVSIASAIAQRFAPFAEGGEPRVLGQDIRFEHAHAPSLIPDLVSMLDHPPRQLTLSQPTLGEVFTRLTGKRLHANTEIHDGASL